MSKPEPLAEVVAANVRHHRERAGLSQAAFAEILDRDARWIRRVESGGLDLKLSTVEMLAAALGVQPNDLFRRRKLVRRGPGTPARKRRRTSA